MSKNVIDGTVIFVGDVSGSITSDKKARYKEIVDYYKRLYSNSAFISHTTVAKFTTEKELLGNNESGGTYISSGLKLAIGEVAGNSDKDNLIVVMGDGDNWSEDNDKTINLLKSIGLLTKVVFHEIYPSPYSTTMAQRIRKQIPNMEVYQTNHHNEEELKEDMFGNKPRRESFNLNIKIDIIGDKTIAKLNGKVAEANLNPTDVYDKDTGVAIAVGRLFDIEVEVDD